MFYYCFQVNFSHILPYDAVVSAFRLTTDDVIYEGVVQIRGKAKNQYPDNLVNFNFLRLVMQLCNVFCYMVKSTAH